MADRRVKVVFSAEVQNFKAGMAEAAAATNKTKQATEAAGKASEQASKVSADGAAKAAEAAKKHQAALENVGQVATGVGLAAVAGVGLAIKSYADFDKQMSSVKAATHETAGNMDLLKQAAISAGAETAFSATEAAQGIEELAKAGVSTKDILNGGLAGALDLAAAGGQSVAESAEIAASALTQFGLSGEKVPHVADLLSAAAGKAQGSVSDMGAALNQVGLVAAQTGLTIEETTGGLAAFASAGLTGSDAGTSFKTMLAALTPNSEAAATAMSELGISAYDSQGNFVGLSEFAGQLRDSLSGLTDEQRNSTLETIFGSDAVRAASVLYEQGAEGVQKWEDAVNDAGYAAETAALMQDNLAGDLEKLGGAFDTVLLQSGSGANEVLRGLVQGLEGFIDAVGKVPAPVLSAGTGLVALIGGAGLLAGGLITVIPKIRETKEALEVLAPAGSKARTALEGVGRAAGGALAIGALTVVVAKLAEADYMSKIDTGMGRVAKALAEVTTNSPNASAALDSLFKDRDGGNLINGVEDLNTAMQRTFNKNRDQDFNDWAEGIVNGMTGVKGSSQILEDSFGRVDDSLASMVSGGKAEDAAKAFERIEAAAKIQGASVEELAAKFPAYNDALAAAEAEATTAAGATEGATDAIKGAGSAAEGAAPTAKDLADSLAEVGVNADGSIDDLAKFTEALLAAGLIELSARDAARGFEEAIDAVAAAAAANGQTMDITTEKGRANQAALDAVARAGMSVVEANAANGASQQVLQGNLDATYDNLVSSAKALGATDDEAIALARDLMGIPPGVSIQSWMSSEAKRIAQETGAAADAVNGKTVNVYVNTHETTFQKVIRQLSGDTSAPVGAGTVLAPKKATGGRLAGYADGGQLPTTGPGTGMTDGFLGISSLGMPLARVDAGEWIINGRSSDRYNRELAAINAGTFPKLPGYANGGREYAFGNTSRGSGAGSTEIHNHYHVDAKPGLAHRYAQDIAHETATRTRDINAAYGI